MALLSKAAILAADDRKYEDVDVPEWGGTVRVLGLSGTDRDAYEAMMVDARKQGVPTTARLQNFRAKLLAKALVDEDGNRLFSDGEVKELGAKSGAVIDRLFDVARELAGMGDEALKAAEGNSEGGQNESSTSD